MYVLRREKRTHVHFTAKFLNAKLNEMKNGKMLNNVL